MQEKFLYCMCVGRKVLRAIGESSKGRTPDFDSVYPGSNPGSPATKIKYAGVMELVDMLGLEPSALRCAGSSPVPGKMKC